jgi:hypothetical protein
LCQAVGIRDYGQQVEDFDQQSSWKIPADKIEQVMQAARDFITYAQNCCRTRAPDDDEIHRLANALSGHIRAVVAMERESRAVFAPQPAAAAAGKKPSTNPFFSAAPAPAPVKAFAPPTVVHHTPAPAPTPAPAASGGGGNRISDLFADVVPPGAGGGGGVVLPPSSTYGDIGQINSSRPAASPAMAQDDELDSLLDGLEANAPAAAAPLPVASKAVDDELDMLTADLSTATYSTEPPKKGPAPAASSAESELDDLLADL